MRHDCLHFATEHMAVTSGRFRGAHPAHTPPTAQNFLNFMQFFAKFGKIICWHPPGGLAPPPMGNPGSAPGDVNVVKNYLNSKQNLADE